MILLKTRRVKDWLKNIQKNQRWLADKLGVGKAYVNQVLTNRCKISRPVMNKLLELTHIDFEGLFYYDDEEDTRKFYGKYIWFRGEMMLKKKYFRLINEKLGENGDVKKVLDNTSKK